MFIDNTVTTNIALDDFHNDNPLDFYFLDEEGKRALYLLSDDSLGRTHQLALINKSKSNLIFEKVSKKVSDLEPGPDNYHFELRFRPGTLLNHHIEWINISTPGWRLKACEHQTNNSDSGVNPLENGTISLFFLFTNDEELSIEPESMIHLTLLHLKGGLDGGSRGSRIEMRYQKKENEKKENEKIITRKKTTAGNEHLARQERIQILYNRGTRVSPLNATFVKSNTILNDGNTANDLELQITSMLLNDNIRLFEKRSEMPTKFILSFDTSEEPEAWALTTKDQAKAIDIEVEMESKSDKVFHIEKEEQGQSPQWIITVIDEVELKAPRKNHFTINLNNIITSMPSGFTNLYLLYENIPGYWDGQLVVPIEKTPMKIMDEIIGDNRKVTLELGRINNSKLFEVNGDIKAENVEFEHADFTDVEATSLKLGSQNESNLNPGALIASTGKFTDSIEVVTSIKIGDTTIKEVTKETKKCLEFSNANEVGGIIPKGGIIMWSGSTTPSGWALCDGSKSTPDLRGRFIVGYDITAAKTPIALSHPANDGFKNYGAINNTGGELKHTLTTEQMPTHDHSAAAAGSHSHTIWMDTGGGGESTRSGGCVSVGLDFVDNGTISTQEVENHTHTINQSGGDQPHENRPPYYVLAFIMKL